MRFLLLLASFLTLFSAKTLAQTDVAQPPFSITGKWKGIIACQLYVYDISVEFQASGSTTTSMWQNKMVFHPKYNALSGIRPEYPPAGEFNVTRIGRNAFTIGTARSGTLWKGLQTVNVDKLVLDGFNRRSSDYPCSSITLFKNSKSQKLALKEIKSLSKKNKKNEYEFQQTSAMKRANEIAREATISTINQIADTDENLKNLEEMKQYLALVYSGASSAKLDAIIKAKRNRLADEKITDLTKELISSSDKNIYSYKSMADIAELNRDALWRYREFIYDVSPDVLVKNREQLSTYLKSNLPSFALAEAAKINTESKVKEIEWLKKDLTDLSQYIDATTFSQITASLDEKAKELTAIKIEKEKNDRLAYERSPKGRLEKAKKVNNDEFAILSDRYEKPLGLFLRLMWNRDFEAAEEYLRQLADYSDKALFNNPASNFMNIFAPNIQTGFKRSVIKSRFAGMIGQFGLERQSVLGYCGDKRTEIVNTTTFVTRYLNIYGFDAQPNSINSSKSSFYVSSKFAPMIAAANVSGRSPLVSNHFSTLIRNLGPCNSSKLKRLERNMIDFYYNR